MSSKDDGGELTRVNSYQWPSGHVGHLTENQSGALQRFRELAQKKGYFDPGDDNTPPSHDDETLLRYLRARKFIPQEAFVQLKDTEDWRQENQLDKLYETIDAEEYDQTRKLYPQWTGRRDKRGIPLYVYEISSVDPKAVSAYSSSKDSRKQSTNAKVPWKMLKLFALYENLCRFVLPLCSAMPDRPNAETPISQSNNIVDLSGVGVTKLFNLRNHMSDASKLATSYYPETLDRIFVIGAPSFFPTVWQWAKNWFDPITVSKIFILSNSEMGPTLAKYVDLDNVPKKYGGNLDWQFGDMPFLEPAIANRLQWKTTVEDKGHKTLPIGPIKWRYDDDGNLMATATGSQNGKPRASSLAGLKVERGVTRLALYPGRENKAKLNPIPISTSRRTSTTKTTEASNTKAPPTVPKMNDENNADLNVGKDPRSAVQDSSRAGTYTVPFQENSTESRQGTSETRYQQQASTHAEGQLADQTPDIKLDGQGSRQAVIDPNTVGQAPKEHPLHIAEEPQPTMIDQAKDMAGQAIEQAKQLPATVMSAVGMGHKEEPTVPASKKEDPAIDGMDSQQVEEFLRNQTKSKSGQ